MKSSRREILKFAGGTLVGALFTPAPWRLITDTALWSENWPGIPRPARGEVRAKFTHCTLCPAGCAVKARCIGEQPVSLAGVGGGLCPFGVGGHQLPYHPDRVRKGTAEEAAVAFSAAIANRGPSERVAVLDARPGRTASWTYRRAMAAVKGLYIAPPLPAAAVKLENARTVLSVGAPLLDGWMSPAKAFAARNGFHLIQAEAVESRTAVVADEWLPIHPGSERALILALAGELSGVRAATARERSGLTDAQISSLASRLEQNGPALVIDRDMSQDALAVNIALGGWNRTVFPRAEAPVPAAWKDAAPVTEWNAVPEGSLRALLIDGAAPGEYLPWNEIRGKLAEGAIVVACGWSRDAYGREANFFLPAAVYPEAADDVAPGVDTAAPSFRPAPPLVPAPEGVVDPAGFAAKAAGIEAAGALEARANAIHAAGRGTLLAYADGKTTPVKEMKAEDFWKALNAGGCWTGEAEKPGAAPKTVAGELAAATGNVLPAEPEIPASPLMSKVYQESDLRLDSRTIALSPADAAAWGVRDGGRAALETDRGRREVRVLVDAGLRRGAILAGSRELAGAQAKVVRI
jgi:menaquinone reductase, molybdopterin-binding-like subunit